jgi:hypothetical protein
MSPGERGENASAMLDDLARSPARLRLVPSPRAQPCVLSEAGRLRRVLVHRPGAELARLTPETMRALLFDDLPWPERAEEEHDAFTDLLRSRDVEVLYLDELLADVLAHTGTRRCESRIRSRESSGSCGGTWTRSPTARSPRP